MKIDFEYLMKEFSAFREIMCSAKFTLDQKDDAFNGFVYVVLHNDLEEGKDKDIIIALFQATEYEWTRRRLYEVFHR